MCTIYVPIVFKTFFSLLCVAVYNVHLIKTFMHACLLNSTCMFSNSCKYVVYNNISSVVLFFDIYKLRSSASGCKLWCYLQLNKFNINTCLVRWPQMLIPGPVVITDAYGHSRNSNMFSRVFRNMRAYKNNKI